MGWQDAPVVNQPQSGGAAWEQAPVVAQDPRTREGAIIGPAEGPPAPVWTRGVLAPVERNESNGQLRLAWPQVALDAFDAFKLPGDVASGRVPDMDPRMGAENVSDETFSRILNASGMMTPITPASRFAMRGLPVNQNAAQRMRRALADDQIMPAEVQSRLNTLGKNAVPMDLGPNLQQRAGGIASVPGPAQQILRGFIQERGAQAGARVADDVAGVMGTGAPAATMAREIAAEQSAAAKPLYDAIRGVVVNRTGTIDFVLNTPMGRRAFAGAITKAANDGVELGSLSAREVAERVWRGEIPLSEIDQFIGQQELTVGVLDYVKRSLDDLARRGGDDARQASALARMLRQGVDNQVPEYATARETFAGFEAVQEAMTMGTELFKRGTNPTEFADLVRNMTASERDALARGARAALEDMMGDAVNDVVAVRNALRRNYNREKLALVIGQDGVDELIRAMERELVFGDTANTVARNSITAARQVGQMEAAPNLRPTARPSTVLETVLSVFDAARNRVNSRSVQNANEAFARMLTDPGFDPRILQGPDPWKLPAVPLAVRLGVTGAIPQAEDGGPYDEQDD